MTLVCLYSRYSKCDFIYYTSIFFIPGVVDLTSEVFGTSVDPNNPCLEDRLVYTCTTSGTLTWRVGTFMLAAYAGRQTSTQVGNTREDPQLPGVVGNLTNIDGIVLTSTLTISTAESVANESVILCEGEFGNMNSTVVRQIGEIVWEASGSTCICSTQSENLHSLEIVLCIFRILRVRFNLKIVQLCMHSIVDKSQSFLKENKCM